MAAKTNIPRDGAPCPNNGIAYHLPKRLFKLSVTIDKSSKITSIAATTTAPLPDIDTKKQYCGVFSTNLLAENSIDFEVSKSGLLTKAASKSDSKVSEALKELAEAAGYGVGIVALDGGVSASCPPGLTHTLVLDPDDVGKHPLCGVKFTLKGPPEAKERSIESKSGTSHNGVFYRQEEPYTLTARGPNGATYSTVLLAPNASPTQFLPLPRTFFSDSDTTFGFDGGMPTQYKVKTGSEILEFLSIPADVLGAYFDAVGAVFAKIGAAASAESKADALISQQATALATQERQRLAAEAKLRACQEAVASGDSTKIAEACK